jgi:FHA domain
MTADQQRGRHFQIRFDPDKLKYFIKDLGIGHGVFVKQEEPIVRLR